MLHSNLAPKLLSLLATASALGGNWPQWRGPEFDGSAVNERPPATFSPTQNVAWAAAMPGPSAATPCVWNDRVFLPSADESAQVLVALCLSNQTGQVAWRREIAPGTHRDNRSTYASASPVTDGHHVWFYYSTGDLVAFDFDGTEIWRRNIQKDYGEYAFLWTFSSSPLFYDGRLYLQVLQRDVPVSGRGKKDGAIDSFVLALDPQTGRELWRQSRPSDARQESREAFSSPIPLRRADRPEILITGGDCITGHDPATGREIWRWGTWNPSRITHWRLVTSPVSDGTTVLACTPKGGPVYALKAGAQGTLPEDGYAWKSDDREVSADVPTPLHYAGRFYVLNGNRQSISCVEPADGRVVWTGALDSRAVFEASPTAADGRVYAINQRGQLFVVAAGNEFKLLAQVDLGGPEDRTVRSSVAIAGNRLYVRTDTRLLCIGDR